MANKVLSDLIKGKISWDDFVYWLNPKGLATQDSSINTKCSQGDFVVYVVNLLHNEVSSFIQKSSKRVLTTKKNIVSTDIQRNRASNGRRIETLSSSNSISKITNVSSGNLGTNSAKDVQFTSIGDCVLNKSLDSYKNSSKYHLSVNGVKYSNSHHNYSPKSFVNNSSSIERKCDPPFIHTCHLSPIPKETLSSKADKYVDTPSETDSPNSRVMQRDGKVNSARRASILRATSSPCNSSFSLSDHAFPAIGSPAKNNSSHKRRIKPTRLVDSFEKGSASGLSSGSNFGGIVRNVEPNATFSENIPPQFKEENSATDFRYLLRLEKQKLQQSSVNHSIQIPLPTQVSSLVVASPECVKFRKELMILARLYSLFLDTNLVCNITSEMNLIISLLIVQEPTELTSVKEVDNGTALKFFVSVHDCVLFATAVLNEQRLFLSTLDKACLKLLINNKRISTFTPQLWEYLCDLFQLRSANKSSLNSSTVIQSSVCFQSDTDNRENFPNDKAFSSFRKQRDAFYEILAIWEENHTLPGWAFNVALGQRVRSLLGLNDEPANFVHFARLFRSQLLGSCRKYSNPLDEETNDALAEVVKCLKEGNPDKYSRLHERLITPVKSSNTSAVPDFPGQQEFFRDFIVSACNAVFNTHLIDSLWQEIMNLDSSSFSASEVEDGDTTVDKDTKRAFITCVNNLQLLAKFLGFVRFLPYRTKSLVPETLMEKQVSLRVEVHPPVDVLTCLHQAVQYKKLLLTIPWVVQYLSMIDKISFTIPYYREILSFLFSLYRMTPLNSSPYGCFILKVCLGWLFDLPQLSGDCFYRWCLNESQYYKFLKASDDSHSVALCIDELDLVEWDSLQAICPFVENLKGLLMSDTNHLNIVAPHRHITPVHLAAEQLGTSTSHKQLELKLEENFFEGQPRSVRQTIEFVAERIASSCVKYICNKPLRETKEKAIKLLQDTFDAQNKEGIVGKIPVDSSLLSHELKVFCQDFVPKFCQGKCQGVLPLLLAEDVPEEVCRVSIEIVLRLSVEKVNVWINSHITPAFFAKDLISGSDKMYRDSLKTVKASHVLSNGWRDVSTKDALSPADSMALIRKLIWSVMRDAKVKEEEILSVLDTVLNTLQARRDLIPSAERILGTLTVDFVLALLSHLPAFVKVNILTKLLVIWKTPEVATSKCFENIICSRNIMFLNHSHQRTKTWSAAANFLFFILKNDLVTPTNFETQCVAIFQQEWPMDMLKNLASCFEEVVNLYQKSKCNSDGEFVLLLELVCDLCQGMDYDGF